MYEAMIGFMINHPLLDLCAVFIVAALAGYAEAEKGTGPKR